MIYLSKGVIILISEIKVKGYFERIKKQVLISTKR